MPQLSPKVNYTKRIRPIDILVLGVYNYIM